MNFTEEQKNKIAAWAKQGLLPAEIQGKIATTLGVRLTYMDVRLLLDDLQIVLDPKPKKVAIDAPLEAPQPDGVFVSIDKVQRPGTMLSGSVTFSDKMTATWQIDATGRIALAPASQGYRPSETDLQVFQQHIQSELQRF
ncbi:MAG: hypothetical protein A2Y14_00105 [Verrucomicrobia bacterium GWF2_51_19]|nr:MAG: hypothetical protein A2Y14_00105 [Verrucomicrobia bacterium GWF2_51_19]HCJ11890.1 hypothetical protein [Opitutae bacterium]